MGLVLSVNAQVVVDSSFFLNGDGGVPVWSRVSYVPSVFLGDEEGEE